MPDDNSSTMAATAPVAPMGQGVVSDVSMSDPVNSEPMADVPAPAPVDPATSVPAADSVVVEPVLPEAPTEESASDISVDVVRKIGESHNVLIALSTDPSVDEMSAAIGLSLFLDKLGKRATAIYSGATPNALEFLKPEETFESTADALQDFVIALNKEKADHLRYKLDGDFVKIYITPYRTRISEDDLDYSYGDFNVDLVLALDVANGVDLDSALREHGRIMHDATIVNITTGNPGKLGEIEWSDKTASSVSEMIAKLLYSVKGAEIEKEEATAFLTGIVAATNRFSNASTTPETMKIASKLMESGANQQLISKNITPDVENEMINMLPTNMKSSDNSSDDPTKLDIEHGHEEGIDESKEVDASVNEKESTLLDDLKAAEASLAHAGGETVPDDSNKPLEIESGSDSGRPSLEVPEGIEEEAAALANEQNASALPNESTSGTDAATLLDENVAADGSVTGMPSETSVGSGINADMEATASAVSNGATESVASASSASGIEPGADEKVVAPPADFGVNKFAEDDSSKYGQMLEDALANSTPVEPTAPIMSPNDNPAAMSAPSVPTAPEINGVPEMNYMPMPEDEILPPPPAPMPFGPQPVSMPPEPQPTPTLPEPQSTPTSLGSQPAMQDQVYHPQAVDPGAFKIPGM